MTKLGGAVGLHWLTSSSPSSKNDATLERIANLDQTIQFYQTFLRVRSSLTANLNASVSLGVVADVNLPSDGGWVGESKGGRPSDFRCDRI